MKKDIHKLADWLEELTAEGLEVERKLAEARQAQERKQTLDAKPQAA